VEGSHQSPRETRWQIVDEGTSDRLEIVGETLSLRASARDCGCPRCRTWEHRSSRSVGQHVAHARLCQLGATERAETAVEVIEAATEFRRQAAAFVTAINEASANGP
jgi:hypothetical protein